MKRWSLLVVVVAISLLCVILAVRYGCSKRCYRQTTSPMVPTIKVGDHIWVDLSAYAKSRPQRWDVVLFHPPAAAKRDSRASWDMRVVGLPGESITIQDDGIYIDGKRMAQPPIVNAIRYQPPPMEGYQIEGVVFPYAVPADAYFVVGDNTTAFDSRFWGALPSQNILGKVVGK